MEFRLISDCHLEWYASFAMPSLPHINGDKERVLVIAGDFHTLKRAENVAPLLTEYATRFKAVVYVPGNHEYYGSVIKPITNLFNFQKMNPEGLDNIHFLIRDSVVIDGIRFVGATLWTNMDRGNPVVEFTLSTGMNDFRVIDYHDEKFDHYGKFKPRHWQAEHKKDLEYIAEEVGNSMEPCVVVTHHPPSAKSLDPKFANEYYMNFGYHSDLSEFILDRPNINFWCHGHVHVVNDYMIGDTNVICNPYGYPDQDDTGFLEKSFYRIH